MFRVTSLTQMPERELNRWIRRIALLFLVVLVGFVAFYAVDRFRAPTPLIVDRELSALEAAAQQNPSDLATRGRLADIYTAKGRYADAIAQYDQIIQSGTDAPQARLGRATAYRLSGQLDAAAKDYQVVVDDLKGNEMANVDPALESSLVGLGMIAVAQDRPKDAIEPLTTALKLKRSDADALSLLGTAYLKTNHPDDAIKALRSAIDFVPMGWAEPYASLAAAYTAKGDTAHASWATAMADISTAPGGSGETTLTGLVTGPAALDATMGLGLLEESRGNLPAAAVWYGKAIAIDPTSEPARMGLARVAPASAAPAASADASPAASK